MIDLERIPKHIAIIMDGNGRWAKKRNLPRVMGHNAGMKAMKAIVRRAGELGVEHLTVYAFSTENWKRSEKEISGIFNLLTKYVDSELDEIIAENVKIQILGDYSPLPRHARERVEKAVEKTKEAEGMRFNIALNYGARDEIVRSVKRICEEVEAGEMTSADIDEEAISSQLYTGRLDIPDPELIIRTSGEERLSNFLMWQAAYSEFVFRDELWPDFSPQCFEDAIEEFQNRNRRFGGRKQ